MSIAEQVKRINKYNLRFYKKSNSFNQNILDFLKNGAITTTPTQLKQAGYIKQKGQWVKGYTIDDVLEEIAKPKKVGIIAISELVGDYQFIEDLQKQMKSNQRYYMEAFIVDGRNARIIDSELRGGKNGNRDFSAVFRYEYRKDNIYAMEDYLQTFNDVLLSNSNYGYIKWTLKVIPKDEDIESLPVKNDEDINCMLRIIANAYPRQEKRALEIGRKMREEGTETIGFLKQVANELHHKYTLLDFNGDVLGVVRGNCCGTRNLNIVIYDGHAYSENLKFCKMGNVSVVRNIIPYLEKEINTCIMIYGDYQAYRTYDGRVVVDERFYNQQQRYIERHNIKFEVSPVMTRDSLAFNHWIDMNNLTYCKYYRNEIRSASFECVMWNQESSFEKLEHFDRNCSFCSITEPTNKDAYCWYQRYLIPQNLNLYVHNPTYEFIKEVSGIVICSFDINPQAHPAIIAQFNNHKNPYYTTPFIVYCVENDIISGLKLYKCMWGTHKSSIKWNTSINEDRRIYIGKCHQDQRYDTYYFTSQEHRAYHFNRLREQGVLCKLEHSKTLSVPRNQTHQYTEVRTFFMTYQAIAMFEIIRKYGQYIRKIGTDDIYLVKGIFSEPLWDREGDTPKISGYWKRDPKPYKYTKYSTNKPYQFELPEDKDAIVDMEAIGDYMLECLKNKRSLQMGKAGYGKSYQILQALMRMKLWHTKYVYLTPTKKLAKRMKKDYPELNIMNWQAYFGCSWADPAWLENKQIQLKSHKPLVIWDEIFTCDDSVISQYVDYLHSIKATVIMVGDTKQIEPFNGYDNLPAVAMRTDYVCPTLTTDHRSKDSKTTNFKDLIRSLNTEEQACEYLQHFIGLTNWNKFLSDWTPDALTYASTRNMSGYLNEILQKIHQLKYKHMPVPYMFVKDTKWCLNCSCNVCQHAEWFYRGEIVEVKLNNPAPPNTKLAYTCTIHSSIGDTVKTKVFLIKDRNSSLFCNRGIYTAITRVELMSQLVFVEPSEEVRRKAHVLNKDLRDQVLERIKWHTRFDNKKGYKTDLDVDMIMNMVYENDICPYCMRTMRYRDCYDRDDSIWSINRLINSRGHTMDNIEICCHSCNIHKRTKKPTYEELTYDFNEEDEESY